MMVHSSREAKSNKKRHLAYMLNLKYETKLMPIFWTALIWFIPQNRQNSIS